MGLTAVITNRSINIPEGLMRAAGLKDGSEVSIKLEGTRIVIQDAVLSRYNELANVFMGAAEEAGFASEADVIAYCKEVRRELMSERLGERTRVSND